MNESGSIDASEQELRASTGRLKRLKLQGPVVIVATTAALSWPVAYLAVHAIGGLRGWLTVTILTSAMVAAAAWLPLRRVSRERADSAELMRMVRAEINASATVLGEDRAARDVQQQQRELQQRISAALDMAEDEREIVDVVGRCLTVVVPDAPASLLLADNSHSHLTVLASSHGQQAPSCGVESPDRCPASRRAQVLRFPDSEALDACPKLRASTAGVARAATCVPVAVMGRSVGVVHVSGAVGSVLSDGQVESLSAMANSVGARLGLVRVIQENHGQVSTDNLTGLLNRRSLETKVQAVQEEGRIFSAVIADLDHFKLLNDTYGHDVGDRALRLFASILSAVLRSEDLVCRYGGEQFVAVMPQCLLEHAKQAIDHVRTALAAAIAAAGLPTFTASYGIVEAVANEDLAAIMTRAESALLVAKREGRDRMVAHSNPGAEYDDVVVPTLFRPRPKPALVLTRPEPEGA